MFLVESQLLTQKEVLGNESGAGAKRGVQKLAAL
jgi:hypothetical protein